MSSPLAESRAQQTVACELGSCVALVDEKDYVFLIVSAKQGSLAPLSSILNELRTEFYRNNPAAENDLLDPAAVNPRFIEILAAKYSKPDPPSNVAVAKNGLREVTIRMKKAVEDVMGTNAGVSVSSQTHSEPVYRH